MGDGYLAKILIIEDEKLLGRSLAASLEDDGHDAHWAGSGEEAVEWLKRHQADLALIDYQLPGINGIDLLKELVKSHPDTVAIIMTAHADVQTAVEAMKLGAADFLLKPVDLDAVSLVARKNLRQRRISQSLKHEQRAGAQEHGLHQVIGGCAGITKAKTMVRRLSALQVKGMDRPPNVLITGETGTGKDLFARAVHFEGPRCSGSFVHVNCAALPESLVESELFGHVKGAFTDARSSKRGLFEVADQGTLFLDEIGSFAPGLQVKVLTAIETGRIRPVGGSEEISANVHLVAAMNQDPTECVRNGTLREDLYHRLRVVQLELPPLRERGGDLEMLAAHFVRRYCRKFQMPAKKLSCAAQDALRRYDWPGNVRELSHCLESAVLLGGETIEADFIAVPHSRRAATKPASDAAQPFIPLDFSHGPIPLERVERELIIRAMEATGNNVSRAAALLSLSRDTMRYRLDKHGFDYKRNGISK